MLRLDTVQELSLYIIGHLHEVFVLLVNSQLAVGAGALLQDLVEVRNAMPGAQLVHHIIHEVQQFIDQHARVDLFLLAEIDQELSMP
jgi:hypothetical protein